MKVKRLFVTVIIILALAAVLAVPLAGCTDGAGFPTASTTTSLSQATTCKSVNPQTGEPVEPTTNFTPDTPEIFGAVKLSNAPAGTEIKAEWIYVPEDLLIDTWSTSAQGTKYLSSSIARPGSSWPTGDYKLVLYLNGKEATSVSFKVQ